MMCGLPRSGKSTWAKKNKGNAVIVSADQLRLLVYHQRFWAEGEPLKWSIHGIALRMLMEQGVDIIIDETNTTPKRREPLIRMGKEYGYTVACTLIDTSKEECLNRAKAKDDILIQPVIERMAKEFVPPTVKEGFKYISEPVFKNDVSQAEDLVERAFAYALQYPSSKVYVFSRYALKMFNEIRRYQPIKNNPDKKYLEFLNGSRVYFKHMVYREDVYKYDGCRFDCCIIDKATGYPDESLDRLRINTRSSKGYPAEFKII
jgi:predicted kinase